MLLEQNILISEDIIRQIEDYIRILKTKGPEGIIQIDLVTNEEIKRC